MVETPSEPSFVSIARAFARMMEEEVRLSIVRLSAAFLAMVTCTVVLVAAAITTVVAGIIHLSNGLVALVERMTGVPWVAQLGVGIFLLTLPLLAAAYTMRQSKKAGDRVK